MRKIIIVILLLLVGCMGEEQITGQESETTHSNKDINLTLISLTPEDLGFVGWVKASENLSADVYERRFVKVEDTFGAASRLINRVHQYPDAQTAFIDYNKVSQHLKGQIKTSNPGVGDAAVLWTQDTKGYLLFIRNDILVELEYSAPDNIDPTFLVEQAKKVDSKINGSD
jgi:hypothetical protein